MNRGLQNTILFLLPTLIWGSTWYVIKFQLGIVNPILSVAYRFGFAGIVMIAICLLGKKQLKFSGVTHVLFIIQGICLFGLNYCLVYLAEQYLTSGLIAVIFSLIIFLNVIFGNLILGTKVTNQIVIGGLLAISGIALIFLKEIKDIFNSETQLLPILMCLASVILASMGNVISAYSQRKNIPLIQTNAYAMIYGALIVFFISIATNVTINFDTRVSYLLSIIYLAIFGSVVAFWAYLKMLGKIGPEKGAYVIVVTPIIAMIISTIFENYKWQQSALFGMPVLLLGNLIALNRIKLIKLKLKWK